jgi:hypothetical protein
MLVKKLIDLYVVRGDAHHLDHNVVGDVGRHLMTDKPQPGDFVVAKAEALALWELKQQSDGTIKKESGRIQLHTFRVGAVPLVVKPLGLHVCDALREYMDHDGGLIAEYISCEARSDNRGSAGSLAFCPGNGKWRIENRW